MKPVIIIAIAFVLITGISITTISAQSSDGIPSWIKNTALWWGQDQISDDDFLGAMQFLIKEGILVIPSEEIETQEKIDTSQLAVEELKEQAISWNYKDIVRNEERYIGKIIYLTGSIDLIEKFDDNWVRLFVSTKEGFAYSDAEYFYVWYNGNKLLNDDTIEAYVVVESIYEVESMLEGYFQYYPIVTAMHLTCTNC